MFDLLALQRGAEEATGEDEEGDVISARLCL